MHCFLVKIDSFNGQLNEHISYANVSLGDADVLDWVEADHPVSVSYTHLTLPTKA